MLDKYRILNKYRIIVSCVFLIGMVLTWFFYGGIYSLTLGFDYSAPDLLDPVAAQQSMLAELLTYDNYLDLLNFTSTVFPILIFSLSVLIYVEKNGLFIYKYSRNQNQKKVVISTLIKHALYTATVFFTIYIIYMSVGYIFLGDNLSMINDGVTTSPIPKNIFDGLFGNNFSDEHVFLYYLAEGFYKYFVFSFVYSLFSCSIALLSNKIYQSTVISACYFFGVTFFMNFLSPSAFPNKTMLQPTYAQGFDSFVYENPTALSALTPLISLIFPILISVILIIIYTKDTKGKDRSNVSIS